MIEPNGAPAAIHHQMIIKKLEVFIPGGDSHTYQGDQVYGYTITPNGVTVVDVKDKGAPDGHRRYFGCAFSVLEEPSSLHLPGR